MTDEFTPVRCGCGGKAKHVTESCWNPEEEKWMPNYWNIIICENCGARTKVFYTKAEAITAWNKAMGRKTGYWNNYKDEHGCSVCHSVVIQENWDDDIRFDFCPYCGADMRGDQ